MVLNIEEKMKDIYNSKGFYNFCIGWLFFLFIYGTIIGYFVIKDYAIGRVILDVTTWSFLFYLFYNINDKISFIEKLSLYSVIHFIIHVLITYSFVSLPVHVFGIRESEKLSCIRISLDTISLQYLFCNFGFVLFSFVSKYSYIGYITLPIFIFIVRYLGLPRSKKISYFTSHKIVMSLIVIVTIFMPTMLYLVFGIKY